MPVGLELVVAVAGKRLRVSIVTGRWLVLVTLLLLAFAGSLGTGLYEYDKQFAAYQAERATAIDEAQASTVYRQVRVNATRPPEKLGILAVGLGGQYGTSAEVRGQFGPPRFRARERANPLLAAYGTFDVTTLLALVGALLAVLVACDSAVGEKEAGTLALVLSQPVRRSLLVVGEYVGVMLSVGGPLVVTWGVVFLVFGIRPDLGLTADTASTIALMAGLSMALVSAFSLLGLAISSSVRESASAAVIALLCWVAGAVVAPSAGAWLAQLVTPVPFVADVAATSVLEQVRPGVQDDVAGMDHDEALRARLNEASLTDAFGAATPLTAFTVAASRLAMTDVEAYRRFVRWVAEVDVQFRAWQADRRRHDPARMSTYIAGQAPLDLDGLPDLRWRGQRLSGRCGEMWALVGSLIGWNLLLYLWSVHAMERYDARPR